MIVLHTFINSTPSHPKRSLKWGKGSERRKDKLTFEICESVAIKYDKG